MDRYTKSLPLEATKEYIEVRGFHSLPSELTLTCASRRRAARGRVPALSLLGCPQVAKKHGLTPIELALGFAKSRWFVTSTIIGATSLPQLKENIDAFEARTQLSVVWLSCMRSMTARGSCPTADESELTLAAMRHACSTSAAGESER